MHLERDNQIDLKDIYGGESAAKRYRRLVAGESASWFDLAWHELVLMFLPMIPGALGIGLRSLVYPLVFRGMQRSSYLGQNVALRNPRAVCLGRGVMIDDYVQFWATSRRDRAIELGDNCFVRGFATLNAGPPNGFIRVGARSSIGQYVMLYGTGGLEIGDDVMIAAYTSVIASSHRFGNPDCPMNAQGVNAKGIKIGNNVWIGAGARILDGVTIGEGAIVGANAVVTRNIPAGTTVVGVPAAPLLSRSRNAE